MSTKSCHGSERPCRHLPGSRTISSTRLCMHSMYRLSGRLIQRVGSRKGPLDLRFTPMPRCLSPPSSNASDGKQVRAREGPDTCNDTQGLTMSTRRAAEPGRNSCGTFLLTAHRQHQRVSPCVMRRPTKDDIASVLAAIRSAAVESGSTARGSPNPLLRHRSTAEFP
ncbi:uncharacterized protein EI97DRAFT_222841 [Westerdykella ornata]|uniref:Uncharacterized protein n=1 Tax=Westerdykella ornata TaxID=318751 RepID=A0A6A6JRM3_WESOR|nr:uncharacterized protein EI97DRAFT_222841 [Westerdykella ornata]KAF2278895.1 hypothetical protein EI97DRAFT_222841 [Westerdykella ornata]